MAMAAKRRPQAPLTALATRRWPHAGGPGLSGCTKAELTGSSRYLPRPPRPPWVPALDHPLCPTHSQYLAGRPLPFALGCSLPPSNAPPSQQRPCRDAGQRVRAGQRTGPGRVTGSGSVPTWPGARCSRLSDGAVNAWFGVQGGQLSFGVRTLRLPDPPPTGERASLGRGAARGCSAGCPRRGPDRGRHRRRLPRASSVGCSFLVCPLLGGCERWGPSSFPLFRNGGLG